MHKIVKPAVVPHPNLTGYGVQQGTALVDGDLVLAGRLGNIEWRSHELQVVTCGDPDCGNPGCADDGYVVLKRAGNFVVWAPAVDLMDGPHGKPYGPPIYFDDGLAPLWSLEQWDRMAPDLGWPASAALPPLTWSEAKLLAGIESPRGVLTIEQMHPHATNLEHLDLVLSSPDTDKLELLRLCDLSGWEFAPEAEFRIEGAGNAELLSLFVDDPYEELTVFGRMDDGQWWPWLLPGVLLVPVTP